MSNCIGCHSRGICPGGVFVKFAPDLRPACIHLCDEPDTVAWVNRTRDAEELLHEFASILNGSGLMTAHTSDRCDYDFVRYIGDCAGCAAQVRIDAALDRYNKMMSDDD